MLGGKFHDLDRQTGMRATWSTPKTRDNLCAMFDAKVVETELRVQPGLRTRAIFVSGGTCHFAGRCDAPG